MGTQGSLSSPDTQRCVVSARLTMLTSAANGAVSPQAVILDGLWFGFRKVGALFYAPRVTNNTGVAVNVTYSSSTRGRTDEADDVHYVPVGNGAFFEPERDDKVRWSAGTETTTVHLVVDNLHLYRVEWIGHTIGTSHFVFISVERMY